MNKIILVEGIHEIVALTEENFYEVVGIIDSHVGETSRLLGFCTRINKRTNLTLPIKKYL